MARSSLRRERDRSLSHRRLTYPASLDGPRPMMEFFHTLGRDWESHLCDSIVKFSPQSNGPLANHSRVSAPAIGHR